MAGTGMKALKLLKVIDGDTVKVEINSKDESLRLCCLDTEESWSGGSKPVTNAGKLASKWAKKFFGVKDNGFPEVNDEIMVDIEFDTNDPVPECLKKHRGNYNRLICYIFKEGVNYNLEVVKKGWSPYFVKYGRSRRYHDEFLDAESVAQARGVAVWNPDTNAGGKSRDYETLIPWWHLRESVIHDFRRFGIQGGVQSVRLDYEDIVEAAESGSEMTILCDLQGGISRRGNGALIFAGSPTQKFNLWIPDWGSQPSQDILRLIGTRYSGRGRGYVYVSGEASLYRGKPQIVLAGTDQLSDQPPGI